MIKDWETKRLKLGAYLVDKEDGMTILKEIEDDYANPNEWENKYNELRTRYLERFFSSGSEVKEDQEENIEKDTKNIEDQDKEKEVFIEDLFEEREGDK